MAYEGGEAVSEEYDLYDYDESEDDDNDPDGYFDEVWDVCPECGAVFGGDEYVLQRCYACGWLNTNEPDDNDEDYYDD